jgi:glutamyl-tRNA synthetase
MLVTRFAPSPTGFLHIGNARTALFNYLFARKNNAKFLLRIEDTDKERSTQAAIDAIFDGLKWMGINYDDEVVYQSSRVERHREVAYQLLESGKAYKCYHSGEELERLKAEAFDAKKIFISKWRDYQGPDISNQEFCVRLKSPSTGETIVDDLIQGKVVTKNEIIEDTVILRSDGTPTYMLAVVVDDHDMGVTNIIRGDDHLNNTARQVLIYKSMDWQVPSFAHVALIHGEDGAKLSKRHGALSVMDYKNMGFLPETMRNYLLRLGFSHGNDEIISDQEAIEWFDLKHVGKSPSRLDFKKLDSFNAHYINICDNKRLYDILSQQKDLSKLDQGKLDDIFALLKPRAKRLTDLSEQIDIFLPNFLASPNKDDLDKALESESSQGAFKDFASYLKNNNNFDKEHLFEIAKKIAEDRKIKIGELAQILRLLLTGKSHAPSVFDLMVIIGREKTIERLSQE